MPVNFLKAGRLSAIVQRLTSAGKRLGTILAAVAKELGRLGRSTIEKEVEYWRETHSKAKKLNKAEPNAKLVDYTSDKKCKRPNVLRVGYTMPFYNPITDSEKVWGGYIDVDILTGLDTFKKKVLSTVVDAMMLHYEYDKVTPKQINQMYNSILIQSVECIAKGAR